MSAVKLGVPDSNWALQDLPFCFRVISPSSTLILQAESLGERAAWVAALQGVIAELLTSSSSRFSPGAAATVASLRSAAGNGLCADCGDAEPDWASLNLGVVICQRCAGAHRRLGPALSVVRSLTLDTDAWTAPTVGLFQSHSNSAAAAAWGCKGSAECLRAAAAAGNGGGGGGGANEITASSSSQSAAGLDMATRISGVRAKYVDRIFVPDDAKAAALEGGSLAAAAADGDLPMVMALLAAGASARGDGLAGTPSPLHCAAGLGSVIICQVRFLCRVHAACSSPFLWL